MDIKNFLKKPEIQELLAEENLYKIYDLCPFENSELTEFFVGNGIEPLNYMSRIVQGMYFDSRVTEINIPHNIISIGDGAFSGCSSLRRVTIPDSVTFIGNSAFYGCTSLETITIPYGVPSIGKYAFSNCNSLQSVTIPSSVTNIDELAFNKCSRLTNITIPDSVTWIGICAFRGCDKLTISCAENSYIKQYAEKYNIPVNLTN